VIKSYYDKELKGALMLGLVHRARFGSSIDKSLLKGLQDLSKKTRIPMSAFLDEAIRDLLKKHDFPIEEDHKE